MQIAAEQLRIQMEQRSHRPASVRRRLDSWTTIRTAGSASQPLSGGDWSVRKETNR